MKKTLPLFSVLTMMVSLLHGQVTLNSSMAPQPGSMLHFQAFDDPSTFVFDRSGENLTWDFTNHNSHAIDAVIYVDPATTAYPTAYPTANLAVNMTDGIGYIENSTNQELLMGVVGDPGNGMQAMPFYPPMALFEFPYTYGSSMNTSSQVRVKMDGASFGIPATDSVRYHMTLTTTRAVQGWGTLILPDGTYEGALLEKSETVQVDSAWMKVVFIGWILAPGYPETTRDSSYRWLTGELLHPYAEVNFGETGAIDGVTFFKGLNVGTHNQPGESRLEILPNPVSDRATIRLSGTDAIKQVDLLAADGRMCIQTTTPGDQSFVTLDLSGLPAGIYITVVQTTQGERIVKRIVKK